ncbi:MAG: ImmA/IrrE family metallo-endopeptidase [Planctomycetes bacterium]|jgi:hypothetical protein|nr:ImmA/IrrE family metallo-endopeptidase [Planctomycetota bacterium]
MRIPVWAAELAIEFWRDANVREQFPRELYSAVRRAGLSVLIVAELTLDRLQSWLDGAGIVCELSVTDRRLKAALYARNGEGIAFIDGSDSPDEQRYSLAHELAHFLRDYLKRRRQVESRLGTAALDVFDGHRPPRPQERLDSLLRFTQIGHYLHLLDRDERGNPANATIARVEEDADRLAFEILAPGQHIVTNVPNWRKRNALIAALVDVYGLPAPQASRYADVLIPKEGPSDPVLRKLRILN